jgi:hypothetical protein
MTADALATALNVLSPDAGWNSSARPRASTPSSSSPRTGSAPSDRGIPECSPNPGRSSGRARSLPAGWPSGFAVSVDFEIGDAATASSGSGAGGRRRGAWKRPYVAVFVEDAKGRPVRTLCLWYKDRRWLTDLKKWSRLYRDRRDDMAEAASSATRKAGAYTLTWDGRDDADKPVPEGDYTLYIEVVRRTRDVSTRARRLEDRAAPFTHDLAGNAEMKKATVRFGKKS